MEVYGPNEVPYAIALYAVSGVCGPILGPVSFSSLRLPQHTIIVFQRPDLKVDPGHPCSVRKKPIPQLLIVTLTNITVNDGKLGLQASG